MTRSRRRTVSPPAVLSRDARVAGGGYSANLTPDENTGIGSWSEETFVRALRTGRHMGVSRPILPPMPWGAFRNFSDEDLRSIYAYLKTVPPVKNRVPEPLPPPVE